MGLAALDCIPGMKGLTTLGGLARGMKSLGSMGLKGMALGAKGLGKGARSLLGEGGAGAFSRMKTKIFGCGDPVDVATGAMYLQQTDVELPGTLPLTFVRRAASNYRCGWWFGPTWSSTLDQRLEVSDEGVILVTEDGMLLSYEMPSAVGVPAYPRQGPLWPLTVADGGGIEILDPETLHTRYFAPPAEGLAPLQRISDRNGNTITFDYRADGTPEAMRHSGGYHIAFTVVDGTVTELILRGAGAQGADVTVRRFLYTEGCLTGVVGPAEVPLTFAYDERLRIVQWTDTNGSCYRYGYDAQDRCTAQGGGGGAPRPHLRLRRRR
ncbi:DUF6531 domain-containing protein [Streptomyces albogriseolus]